MPIGPSSLHLSPAVLRTREQRGTQTFSQVRRSAFEGDSSMTQNARSEPVNDQSAPVSPAAVTKDGEPVPRRILIVEDNEVARRQLQQLLQSDLQLQVDVTGDGNKALQDLAEH